MSSLGIRISAFFPHPLASMIFTLTSKRCFLSLEGVDLVIPFRDEYPMATHSQKLGLLSVSAFITVHCKKEASMTRSFCDHGRSRTAHVCRHKHQYLGGSLTA